MNLIAKIKRLEAEAAERDKRITTLEEFVQLHGETLNLLAGRYCRCIETPADPKKRKPRKTSGTE